MKTNIYRNLFLNVNRNQTQIPGASVSVSITLITHNERKQ